MQSPPEPGNGERVPERVSTEQAERRRVLKAASLRPINLLMLVVGGFASILFSWWFLPLTLVTYALLVSLATRDPFYEQKTLGKSSSQAPSRPRSDISPERRARWIPRGETRSKVEDALEVYQRVVAAIEESGDVARTVLEDAVPKLHAAADRLVDVGDRREKTSTVVDELKSLTSPKEDHSSAIEKLENDIRKADEEISATCDQIVALRARVAQVSVADTPENRAAALQVNESLDELNLRLEALEETMSPLEEP
ncbi:hypothetical protein BH24ACT22_BH24ACT22_03010 [soil metagenome]